jgi:zinc protease
MLKNFLYYIFFSLLLSFPHLCWSNTLIESNPTIETYQLDNGLTVYLQPRSKAGLELRLIVHSGSLQENENQLGLAHFVEHMAFKGTKNFPNKSSFKSLEEYGIHLGTHINAATSFNSTVYRLSLPASEALQLEKGLTVLSDWAYHISFEQQDYESERDVIIEEWRLRQGVAYRINTLLDELRYHGSLYANRAPIGSLDIIKNAPVQEAKTFYNNWYQPQRMSLVAVGNFDTKSAKQWINTLFGQRSRGDAPVDIPQLRAFSPQNEPLVKVILDREQGQRLIQIALQRDLPTALNTPQGIKEDIFDLVWLTLLNHRLSLLVENQILPSAQINQQGILFDNKRMQYLLFAQPKDQQYLETMRHLFSEVQRMSTSPVSEIELQQVKNQILTKLKQQAENEINYQNDYLANQLVNNITNSLPIQNKAQQLTQTTQILKTLNASDLQKIVGERLNSANLRIAVIGPDSDQNSVNAEQIKQLWQTIRQTQLGKFPFKKEEVNLDIKPALQGKITATHNISEINAYEWQLSNGLRVIARPDNTLSGDVEMLLQIPGGLSLDSDQQLGIMRWSQRLAEDSGYGTYTSAKLNQFSRQHQVSVSPYAELLYHGLRGKAPNDQLASLFKLFYLKLTAANFAPQQLAQTKQQLSLAYSKQPVERQFLDLINQNAFNHGDRLLVSPDGAWRDFSADQLKQNYLRAFALSPSANIIISGRFNIDEIKPLVEYWFAGLPTTDKKDGWVDNGIIPIHQSMQKTYPMASSDKSMVSILYSAQKPWQLRDQLNLELIDYIINLRLRYYVREQASGVYTIIFSQQLIKYPTSYYLARLNFTTAPDKAHAITVLADEVIQSVARNGVTLDELQQAKKSWLLNYQEKKASSTYWLTAMAQTAADGSHFDELNMPANLIEAITLQDTNHLATQLLGKNPKIFTLLPKKADNSNQ